MLRYTDYDIVFREIPDETTLAVNLAGCPNRCPGCHSPQLQEPIGEPLTEEVVERLLVRYGAAVTCFCLMGGDAEPHEAARLALFARRLRPALRTGWYSGRAALPEGFDPTGVFDYVKLGPYIAARGRSTIRRPTSGYGASGPTAGAKISRRGSGANEAEKPIGESKCSPQLRQTPSPPPIAPPRTAGDAATVCGQTPRERPNSGQTDERIGRFEKMLTFTSCFTGFDA